MGFDVLKQDAGLDAQSARRFIELKDLIHALEGQNYAALDGDGAAGLTGACAAHGDGDARLGAELHDGRGLLGARDLDCRIGSPGHTRALVMAVVRSNRVTGKNVFFCNHLLYVDQS